MKVTGRKTPQLEDLEMVNNELPIHGFRSDIVNTVKVNPVTIIVAETGAGKSTQVPQFLLEEGYDLVVTQPRRIAARTVAERVAEEYNTPFGETVGFRTAYDSKDSDATRCLFVTDGLALVRELMGGGNHGILVVDEVHEWNLNVEVLVAWAKRQISQGVDFKVVLMSATMEAERLSKFFDGAPIINVPGRQFPVEQGRPMSPTLEEDVAHLLRAGRNVLVFQPGKAEIARTIAVLEKAGLNAEILPLHGELTSAEQKRCFASYKKPKCVVATNVAQTSITIDDIDAVVDSGDERRIELNDGIEGLYLMPISLADAQQRRGRAGRTKPGIYIDWCAATDRLEFPEAEIERVRLDQTVLRLAEAGFDMEELSFFHQPDRTEIHDAKRALKALGCMDADGCVTRIGRRVAKMPVDVKYGRMIVEAERLGVCGDVITIAAILEQGGITPRCCNKHRKLGLKHCSCWRTLVPEETASDVMAQLRAFEACQELTKDQMAAAGISIKAYYQAAQKRQHLKSALKNMVADESTGDRDAILRAVCAGMVDHLYQFSGGELLGAEGNYRKLSHDSVVHVRLNGWVVGRPFDIQFKGRYGDQRMISLVGMVTLVQPKWLLEVAPQLVDLRERINPRFNPELNEVVSTTEMWFNGHLLGREEKLDPNHPLAKEVIRDYINNVQWEQWSRPAIELPKLDENTQLPEVRVESYGTDGLTEDALYAYGALVVSHGILGSIELEVLWTRDREEAERRRAELVREWTYISRRLQRAQEYRARTQPSDTFLRLREVLRGRLESSLALGLSESLLTRAQGACYGYAFPEEMPRRISTLESLLDEVDAEFIKLEAEAKSLVPKAIELCDRVGTLLRESGDRFTETWEADLRRFYLDMGQLPSDPQGLQVWIDSAEAMIAKVEKYLQELPTDGGVGADMLAALRGRFNGS